MKRATKRPELTAASGSSKNRENAKRKRRKHVSYPAWTYQSLEKQNAALIRKTIELNELRGEVEDKHYELEKAYGNLEKQNVALIRKTIELTELRGELEDKNYDLVLANKQVLSLLKTKTDFMNQVAHDLRTPLTPIITLLPIIKGKVADQKLKQDLTIVSNNAQYLKKLVDELVALIRSSEGVIDYRYERFALKDVIEEVLSNYQNVLDSNNIKAVKLVDNKLPAVMANRLKIVEVLQNIISNSIKFMPKGGTLKIAAYKNDNFIYAKTEDSGIGMTKKTLAKVFTPFFKADTSRHTEGSGLGLSICKKIIEQHGGKIWVESPGIGKGATITFNLPELKEV